MILLILLILPILLMLLMQYLLGSIISIWWLSYILINFHIFKPEFRTVVLRIFYFSRFITADRCTSVLLAFLSQVDNYFHRTCGGDQCFLSDKCAKVFHFLEFDLPPRAGATNNGRAHPRARGNSGSRQQRPLPPSQVLAVQNKFPEFLNFLWQGEWWGRQK